MKKSLTLVSRLIAVFILGVLPTAGCPAVGGKPGGKLLPLASERVRVVFHEDTEMTGEATQEAVAVAASGIWSPGGTDIVIDVNNGSPEAVRVDFSRVKLMKTGEPAAVPVRVVEYVRSGDKQQTVFLYEREKASEGEAGVVIAPGTRRRLQAGFRYQSADNPGGKLGDKATLEVAVQRAPERQPGLFDFAFEYKGR
jgi:hypothetical protein